MVCYLPNSLSILLLLSILREGGCILLFLGRESESLKRIKGPALWKKQSAVNWGSTTLHNPSALKVAYLGVNKQKSGFENFLSFCAD